MGKPQSSLHGAVKKSNIKSVEKKLKQRCPEINKKHNHQTPLFVAVSQGNVAMVKILLESGAKTNEICMIEKKRRGNKREFPWTALLEACRNCHTEIVKLLIDYKCNSNLAVHDGLTPLHISTWHGHRDIVCLLLQANCDVNQLDHFCESALVLPIGRGDIEIVHLLITAGCKLNTKTWGYARMWTDEKFPNHDMQDDDWHGSLTGRVTLFQYAIECGWAQIAAMILQHGFNANNNKLLVIIRALKASGIQSDYVQALIKAFVNSGYNFTKQDEETIQIENYPYGYLPKYVELSWLRDQMTTVPTLKQICRSTVRDTLRIVSDDSSIVARTKQLSLPVSLIGYLQMYEELHPIVGANLNYQDHMRCSPPLYFHVPAKTFGCMLFLSSMMHKCLCCHVVHRDA